ncbi:MAG: hypothetical protein QXE79_01980 [Candidatus Bathyarchaeia archaeon]
MEFSGDSASLNITMREAYFPTWNARSNEGEIKVSRDDLNFISLNIDGLSDGSMNRCRIEMYHLYDWHIPFSLTLTSLAFLLILSIYAIMVKKVDD